MISIYNFVNNGKRKRDFDAKDERPIKRIMKESEGFNPETVVVYCDDCVLDQNLTLLENNVPAGAKCYLYHLSTQNEPSHRVFLKQVTMNDRLKMLIDFKKHDPYLNHLIEEGAVSVSSLFHPSLPYFQLTLLGPKFTPFYGGNFHLCCGFPSRYPFIGPSLQFTTPIFHPNVAKDGTVNCAGLEDGWSPITILSGIVGSIFLLMREPRPERRLPTSFALDWSQESQETAREWTRLFATTYHQERPTLEMHSIYDATSGALIERILDSMQSVLPRELLTHVLDFVLPTRNLLPAFQNFESIPSRSST